MRTLSACALLVTSSLASGCFMFPADGLHLAEAMPKEKQDAAHRLLRARRRAKEGPVDQKVAMEYALALRQGQDLQLSQWLSREDGWDWKEMAREMVATADQVLPSLHGPDKAALLLARAKARGELMPALDDTYAAFEETPSFDLGYGFVGNLDSNAEPDDDPDHYRKLAVEVCQKTRPLATTPEQVSGLLGACYEHSYPRQGGVAKRLAWASAADRKLVEDSLPRSVKLKLVNHCSSSVEVSFGDAYSQTPTGWLAPGESSTETVVEGVVLVIREPYRDKIVRTKVGRNDHVITFDKSCSGATVK